MKLKENILTLSELTEAYNRGELDNDADTSWYTVYPTNLHKERQSVGFIPLSQVKARSKIINSIPNSIIWRK